MACRHQYVSREVLGQTDPQEWDHCVCGVFGILGVGHFKNSKRKTTNKS